MFSAYSPRRLFIEVLRLGVAHGAAAEAQHLALGVDDGKHHPAPEHIEGASVPADGQPGLLQELRLEALLPQVGYQSVPAPGRRPQAKAADVGIVQSPAVEIIQRLGALPCPKQGMIVPSRQPVRFIHAVALVAGRSGVPRPAFPGGHLHVGAVGQQPHGVHELHPLHIHHEVDDRAALVAAEAVVHLRLGVHAEGGRLFIVERTASPVAPPLLLQGNIFGNHFLQAGPAAKLVQPGLKLSVHAYSLCIPGLRGPQARCIGNVLFIIRRNRRFSY